jgi:hypothetical protein
LNCLKVELPAAIKFPVFYQLIPLNTMLSQLVRPMVHTQIRLLASSQATRATLIRTIAQWLSFLGVHAQVTRLDSNSDRIHVSITVGKPEGCDRRDWEQILRNLHQPYAMECKLPLTSAAMTAQQQGKLQRLLAYVIQVGNSDPLTSWDSICGRLQALGLEEPVLSGIRSALRVPQSLEQLMEGLDADVAAVALPIAVSISLLDRRVNPSEDQALSKLLQAMRQPSSNS